MGFKKTRAASLLGFASVSLSIIPLTYIAFPEAYPNSSLTEAVVLVGGVSGSLVAALALHGCVRSKSILQLEYSPPKKRAFPTT